MCDETAVRSDVNNKSTKLDLFDLSLLIFCSAFQLLIDGKAADRPTRMHRDEEQRETGACAPHVNALH